MSEISYILTPDSVTVIIKGIPKTVTSDHENFDNIVDALAKQDVRPLSEEDVLCMINVLNKADEVAKELNMSGSANNGDFKLSVNTNIGTVTATVKGYIYPLPSSIVKQIVALANRSGNIKALTEFVGNLMENPDMEIAKDLFDFLQSCKLALTPDGCFLAYKKVNGQWKDSHTNTIDNSIGAYVSIPRWAVVRDRSVTCSRGLHVASWNYAQGFSGTHMVVVKVNPKDVVSVPTDYNNEKMRVCAYQVIREVGNEKLESEVYENAMEAPKTHTRIEPGDEHGSPNKSVHTSKSSNKRTQRKTQKKKATVGQKGGVPHNKKYNSERERLDARNARRRELRAQKRKASEAKSSVKG